MHTLLIIDDNAIVREGVAFLLREAGYSVVTAKDGQAAIAQLQDGLPDLILLDMLMPGEMDGWRFLEDVKRQARTKPVPILVTTGTDSLTPEWAAAQGCAGILHKPVD